MQKDEGLGRGAKQGRLALGEADHQWLIEAIGSGFVTKIEAAAKLSISLPTVDAWLKRPIGYRTKRGRPRKAA